MLTPSNRTITIASGGTALVGRTTAIGTGGGGGTPAWLDASGAAVDKIVAIPNTSGFGGANVSYCGWTKKPSTGELFLAVPGGHHDGSGDNRVVGIGILTDTPGWAILAPGGYPSTSLTPDVAYMPDGKPVSRHLYQMIQYVAQTDRIILCGCRFGYDNAVNHPNVDTFSLATNTWDGEGYNQDVTGISGAAVTDYDGDVWYGMFTGKYLPSTRTWTSTPLPGRAAVPSLRHVWATDAVNRQVFGLSWSDGETHDATDGYKAGVMRAGVVTAVTVANSAAFTQFLTDKPAYGGMDYDPLNDCFVYYDAANNRFYKVQLPYASNTATMTMYTPDMSSYTPTQSPIGDGLMARFTYIPQLKGFVGGPVIGNLFYLKTST